MVVGLRIQHSMVRNVVVMTANHFIETDFVEHSSSASDHCNYVPFGTWVPTRATPCFTEVVCERGLIKQGVETMFQNHINLKFFQKRSHTNNRQQQRTLPENIVNESLCVEI